MTISSAEFRARLFWLGLNANTFASQTGITLRTVRRQIADRYHVTPRTVQHLKELEAAAEQDLARFERACEDGVPIVIPRIGDDGERPAGWWHMIAARTIARWGEDAQILYDSSGIEGPDDEA